MDELERAVTDWQEAMDRLELATVRYQSGAAQEAIRAGAVAANRVGELTDFQPPVAEQTRWLGDLAAYQARFFLVGDAADAAGVPGWVWAVTIGLIALGALPRMVGARR